MIGLLVLRLAVVAPDQDPGHAVQEALTTVLDRFDYFNRAILTFVQVLALRISFVL